MKCGLILALAVVAPAWAAQDAPTSKPGNVRTVTTQDGETVTVKVRLSGSDQNIVTVVTFPAEVAHVVHAWDREDLSVVNDSNKLFLKLLEKVQGYVDVITAAGTHLRLLVLPIPSPGPYDSNVRIRLKNVVPAHEDLRRRPNAPPSVRLNIAMRLGEVPPDATVVSGQGEVLRSDESAEMSLLYKYETAWYVGYVLQLSNRSADEAYQVDVRTFTGEKLVNIGSKHMVVPPLRSTRIYIVDSK